MKNNSLKKKRINLIISICNGFFVVCLLCLTIPAFGWFTSTWSSIGDSIEFKAGNTQDPAFSFWTYTTDEEATATGTTAGWKEQNNTVISKTNKTTSGSFNTFTLNSLHFGTMDNLVTIKEDNKVYMRIYIEPEKQGKDIKLEAKYFTEDSNTYIQLYDKDGYDVTNSDVVISEATTEGESSITATVAEQLMDLCAEYPFLDFDYAIDTTSYNPGTTGFDSLEFTTITGGKLLKTSSTNYYLYVRIQPNLISFRKVSSYLNDYMPCIMLFDIELSLTSYKYES